MQRKNKASPENGFGDGDPRTIELESAAERAYWCKALDVTEEQLLSLVSAVGPSVQRVKERLAQLKGDSP